MDEGLLNFISAGCGQLVKMLITLEPHGIYGSNFAYLFIFNIVQSLGMQNGDEALPSIILTCQGI